MSLVSSQILARRLFDSKDPSSIPHPFVFTPSRKDAFSKLLPFPEEEDTIIEGFSQSGKSNFGCHLALIYRMKPQNHAVIYIGNVKKFNKAPSKYIMEEIFYWFYEEIRDSPKVQTMLGQIDLRYVNSDKIIFVWSQIFDEIKRICKRKGKKIVFIFDQYNRISEGSNLKSFFEIFDDISNANILITTNTDPNAEILKLPDSGSTTVLDLNEIDKKIDENEMSKLIKSFFRNQDFAEQLFLHTNANLTLIYLFYNHCCLNKLLENENLNFSDTYGTFTENYISENRGRHNLWLNENQFKPNFNKEELQELMAYVDRDYPFPTYNEIIIDKRFIYIKNKRLHSINPLISKMFLERYWNTSDIEKFLNARGKSGKKLPHGLIGELFELYIKEKFIEKKSFKIRLGDKEIEFEFDQKGHVAYGQKNIPKGTELKGSGYDVIYFNIPKGNSFFIETIQDTFPLLDFANLNKKRLWMISVKFNGDFIHSKHKKDGKDIDYEDYFDHYYTTYKDLAKKQFGKKIFLLF